MTRPFASASVKTGPPWSPGLTAGLYDPATSWFHLRHSNSAGAHDVCFGYGVPGGGWITLVGNWDGVGGESIGLFDPASSTFFLRSALGGGRVTNRRPSVSFS